MQGTVKKAQVIGVDLFGDDGASADYDGPLVGLTAPAGYAIKEFAYEGPIVELDPTHQFERYLAVQKMDDVAEIGVEIPFSFGGDKLPGTPFELMTVEFPFEFTAPGVATATTGHLGAIDKFTV